MADPDLELREGGGAVLTFLSCWPFSLQLFLFFLPKIRGGGGPGPLGPSPGSASADVVFFRFNVWALCPGGYYLNGLRLGSGSPAFLSDIEEGKCCRPQNHPNSYEDCYDEDVSRSFNTYGWSECQRASYYMTGFYKSNCSELNCIDNFRCCKMKKGNSTLSDATLH